MNGASKITILLYKTKKKRSQAKYNIFVYDNPASSSKEFGGLTRSSGIRRGNKTAWARTRQKFQNGERIDTLKLY